MDGLALGGLLPGREPEFSCKEGALNLVEHVVLLVGVVGLPHDPTDIMVIKGDIDADLRKPLAKDSPHGIPEGSLLRLPFEVHVLRSAREVLLGRFADIPSIFRDGLRSNLMPDIFGKGLVHIH